MEPFFEWNQIMVVGMISALFWHGTAQDARTGVDIANGISIANSRWYRK